MKFALIAVALFSTVAFADGIPVPMESQTPYNWVCEGTGRSTVKLHLTVKGSPTLWVNSFAGGMTGTTVDLATVGALITKQYDSLDGKTTQTDQFKRDVTFFINGKYLSLTMVDRSNGGYAMKAINCVASF